jgi:nicotinamidase-related amidase
MPDEFPIIPEKTAVLFFDTLNGYMHPKDPARAAAAEASGVLPKMQQLERACRAAGIPIFYGQADHRPDGADFGPTVVGDPPRVTSFGGVNYSGSWHAAVVDELAPQPEDYVVKKHRWSTFHQTHLELSLRTAGIDTIILVGGSTEVGIASTAYAARDRDFSLIILSDACTSSKPGVKEFFMEQIFPSLSRVMTVDQCLAKIAVAATS